MRRGAADVALEPRRPETRKEPTIECLGLDDPLRSHIAVRKNCGGTVLLDDPFQPGRDVVERFVPTDALEPSFALFANATEGVQDAIGVINHVGQKPVHFFAERAARQRMMSIPLERHRPPVLGRHDPGACVGTIVHAGAAHLVSPGGAPTDLFGAEKSRRRRTDGASVNELSSRDATSPTCSHIEHLRLEGKPSSTRHAFQLAAPGLIIPGQEYSLVRIYKA